MSQLERRHLHQLVQLVCDASLCNRELDSTGCQLVVVWFYIKQVNLSAFCRNDIQRNF